MKTETIAGFPVVLDEDIPPNQIRVIQDGEEVVRLKLTERGTLVQCRPTDNREEE